MTKVYLIHNYNDGCTYVTTTNKVKADKIANKLNDLVDNHEIDDANLSKAQFGVAEVPLVNGLKEAEHAINSVLITPNGKHRLTDVDKSIFK